MASIFRHGVDSQYSSAVTATVRWASTGDAALLARLITASFEEYRPWLVPPSVAHNETEATIAAELAGGYRGLIVDVEGEPAACVLLRPQDGDLYFGRLSVLPGHRRAGLAELLVAKVEEIARAEGCPATTLSVRLALASNQRLFARLGYVETARHAHPGFDEPTFMDMRKVL